MAETIKIAGELESTATGNVVAAASAIKDKVKNKYQGEINAETDATLANHASAINGLNTQNYVTVTATNQTTEATDVLPASGSVDTVYRVGNWDGTQYDETCYSEYAWNGSAYAHLSTKTQIGEVFDISAYHATGGTFATYADLSAALDSNNGGGVPQSLQKGGMSIKFVQSSDNKYVQYFLTENKWSASEADWQKINLEEEVSQLDFNLSGDLAQHIPMSLGYIVCNGAVGTVVDLTPVTHSTYKYAIVSCAPGDVLYIRGKGGNADRLYCFIDSENKVISSAAPVLDWLDYHKLIAPENTAKVIINDETGQAISYFGEKTINKIDNKIDEIPIVARCLDMQYDGNKTVTIDVIYLYCYNKLFKTIYCDGDASSHSPKTFTFGYAISALLVLNSNYSVVSRLNNSSLEKGDIVLLSYSNTLGFDGGGLLYPTLAEIKLNGAEYLARCLDLVIESSDSVTIDVVYLYSKRGYKTYYADGDASSHSPKTFTFGFGGDGSLLVLSRNGGIVQRNRNSSLVDGDILLLSNSNTLGFDGGLLYGEYLRVKMSETPTVDVDNSQVFQSSKKIADSYGNGLTPISIACDENGYELPTTQQERDIQKKIEQLASIKWTPLNAIPNSDGSGSYSSGVEYTGMPYSSVKERDKFVGFEVSLHTFMTAINNPYSLLYTENVSLAHSASAWGKTYHGVNCGTYYGIVCNVFATQCCGFKVIWNTQQHDWQSNYFFNLIRVFNQSAQGLKIGDVVWRNGHDQIVYAIKRNSDGDVVGVVLAESASFASIKAEITAQAFDNMLSTHIVYRGMELFKNKYVPSPFVAIRDEVITPFVYNDDICCFAGDKACFREGETIAINYNLKQVGAWTAMELYKDETLIDTMLIDSSSHVLDLTYRNLSYGKYKARLTDGTDNSDYTEFEILQTTVSKEAQGDRTKISFSSSNGTPVYFRICDIAGNNKGTHEFTEKELNDGYCSIDLVKLNTEQYPSSPISGNTYIKVFFQGEFGCVTNEPLQFNP